MYRLLLEQIDCVIFNTTLKIGIWVNKLFTSLLMYSQNNYNEFKLCCWKYL